MKVTWTSKSRLAGAADASAASVARAAAMVKNCMMKIEEVESLKIGVYAVVCYIEWIDVLLMMMVMRMRALSGRLLIIL